MDKWLPKVGIWNLQERNALECCRHCQREKREHLDENITNIRLMSTEKSRFNWNFKFKERNKTYYDLGEFWPYRSKPQCKPSVGVYGHLCLSFLYLLFPNEFWKRLEWLEAWFLSTNCLSFDRWIFDLMTFKNYKEKLTCTSRIVAISVLLFKAATWRAVLLLFESGSSVNSGHFAVTLFAALEKQRIYSDVMVKTLSKTLFSMAQHFFYDF